MQLNSAQLATLLKFNAGKNGKTIAESCPDPRVHAGTYPVSITVTLDGYLDRGVDGEQTRTTFPAATKAFSIALSKVNPATRAVIVAAVLEVQRGADLAPADKLKRLKQEHVAGTATAEQVTTAQQVSDAIDAALWQLQVSKTTPRTGVTVFRGRIAVEDCEGHAPADITGITLVESCSG